MRLPIVAIVGRPNVGKSTLFNRLLGRREAIVDPTPGVTRDRKYEQVEWTGRRFVLVDTGGFMSGSDEPISRAVMEQLRVGIAEADLVLFLVDGRAGLTAEDEELARMLRRSGKNVLLVVNKIDTGTHEPLSAEFFRLGLGTPLGVSASLGRGIGDLLDQMIQRLPGQLEERPGEQGEPLRLAVVGRPNVGKSSLINAILGSPKLVVTEIPGTTRDAIDTEFSYKGQRLILVDTAGLRRKSRISEPVEYYSTQRTMRAVRRADVVAVVIDASEGLFDQDKRILEQVVQQRKGMLLVVNKWDLMPPGARVTAQFERAVQEELRTFSYVPLLFVSAKTGRHVSQVLELAQAVHKERHKVIRTRELNQFLQEALAQHSPPAFGAKEVKIRFCTQVNAAPPVFAFFCNHPRGIQANYQSYLEKQLRQKFGFMGVPLTLSFRKA
ncbi:MAG: ribosome biogenesis GTPase Der [candidate division KSB1 bacterium]|nr:ribosome biogenesis GTPase Der [candidate division KSB1 bacterium]MDZ7392453.1 ribosome biogenesis GTPase Der [candidate division KSB1 bacterium]